MPDFSQLLKVKTSDVKKPPNLPLGVYPAIIRSYETGESPNKKIPFVRLHLSLLDWPTDVTEDEKAPDGHPIDLSKRQMRIDYYWSADGLPPWRLAELIKSCGIDADQTLDIAVPELVGKQVIAEVTQYLNTNSNEIGNQVNKLLGSEN